MGKTQGKMAPDLSRKVLPMVFMGKEEGSREDHDRTTRNGGRKRTPFSSRDLWIETSLP